MRGTTGLLLYVAVMVLASVLKKIAENKVRQGRPPVEVEGEPYTITLEDILSESMPAGESETSINASGLEPTLDANVGESRTQEMDGFDDWNEWECQETEESVEDGGFIADPMKTPQHPSWEQAVVFSEIIREPRAKRGWPSR